MLNHKVVTAQFVFTFLFQFLSRLNVSTDSVQFGATSQGSGTKRETDAKKKKTQMHIKHARNKPETWPRKKNPLFAEHWFPTATTWATSSFLGFVFKVAKSKKYWGCDKYGFAQSCKKMTGRDWTVQDLMEMVLLSRPGTGVNIFTVANTNHCRLTWTSSATYFLASLAELLGHWDFSFFN